MINIFIDLWYLLSKLVNIFLKDDIIYLIKEGMKMLKEYLLDDMFDDMISDIVLMKLELPVKIFNGVSRKNNI